MILLIFIYPAAIVAGFVYAWDKAVDEVLI